MDKTVLLDHLTKLYNEDIISFHVPGHKNGNIFHRYPYENLKNLLNIDTTEIPGTDNLHHSKGIIKEAQERASKILGSEETFFLVNGSTSGIYSMIMTVTQPGDKVIIPRNSHGSVINGLILADCIPIYLYPEIDPIEGIPMGISAEEVELMLLQHPDTKAVLITYPSYYGIACNLKKIGEIVHKYDKILLVDEAHGAHFGLSDALPMAALACGADMVVQSTHKTLPALTQSSMLHIQGNRIDRDKLKFMLRVHQSSSPSYLLMSSLDMAMTIYQNHGKELMDELLEHINIFKLRIKSLKGLNVLEQINTNRQDNYTLDPTRLWIRANQLGLSGIQLENSLRYSHSIQMELSNVYGVLAIGTIGNTKEDFKQFARALENIILDKKTIEVKTQCPAHIIQIPKVVYRPREALYKEKTVMELAGAQGLISGATIIPYPPGIPILMPGEVITNDMIEYIKNIISSGMEVIGLTDDTKLRIEVIK